MVAESKASIKPVSEPPEFLNEIVQKTLLKRTESTQAYIIIIVSYTEELLTKVLKNSLINLNEDKDNLMDPNGPIFHLGPKVDLAYRLRVVSIEMSWTLHKLRKLRDKCAHSHTQVKLSDQSIKDSIDEMRRRLNDTHTDVTTEDKLQDIVTGVLIILWNYLNKMKSENSSYPKEPMFR
jgi:DNA-binding MltR family transcriptional regulator